MALHHGRLVHGALRPHALRQGRDELRRPRVAEAAADGSGDLHEAPAPDAAGVEHPALELVFWLG